MLALAERVKSLEALHSGLRSAARATGIDAGYLKRLRDGDKTNPSDGYALAAHGTLARDFDLTCIPWVKNPSEPKDVVAEITSNFSLKLSGEPSPTIKEHGRICYTLILSFGECFLDFSFMPTT